MNLGYAIAAGLSFAFLAAVVVATADTSDVSFGSPAPAPKIQPK